MGLGPMQSLRAFHIIQGAVTMKAETMSALVRRSPVCEYLILKDSTDKIATYETKRQGDPAPTTLTYTLEDAKRAGLTSNANWNKHPAAMLRARAVSSICKAIYSDLLLGVYEESEILPDEPLSGLKAQIRAEVVEGQVVPTEEPPEPGSDIPTLLERIQGATDMAALRALVEEVKVAPNADELKEAWKARQVEINGGGK
jgi:hypothetical protein